MEGINVIDINIDGLNDHLPNLIIKSKRLMSMEYDSKCMFLLALRQYIEALYVVECNCKSGEYTINNVKDYVKKEHTDTYGAFEILLKNTDAIIVGCYTKICVMQVEKFIKSDALIDILTEFGIVKKSDLNNAFRAAAKMAGE